MPPHEINPECRSEFEIIARHDERIKATESCLDNIKKNRTQLILTLIGCSGGLILTIFLSSLRLATIWGATLQKVEYLYEKEVKKTAKLGGDQWERRITSQDARERKNNLVTRATGILKETVMPTVASADTEEN